MLAQGIPLHGMGIQAHFSIGALGEVEGKPLHDLADTLPVYFSRVVINLWNFF